VAGAATINAWIRSAILGIPLVDALVMGGHTLQKS